eukprot:Platyproteum_vivax@DN3535_c0_g1_i5.p1
MSQVFLNLPSNYLPTSNNNSPQHLNCSYQNYPSLSFQNSPVSSPYNPASFKRPHIERGLKPFPDTQEPGKWYLEHDNNVLFAFEKPAVKRRNRVVLDFSIAAKSDKKFYLCEYCVAAGEHVWVFHKNYVHQHIPRHHKEQCTFCHSCAQLILNELYNTHVKNCQSKGRQQGFVEHRQDRQDIAQETRLHVETGHNAHGRQLQ